MAEYDLSHPAVKSKMAERYGDSLPLEALMISPEDIYQSDILFPVAVRSKSK